MLNKIILTPLALLATSGIAFAQATTGDRGFAAASGYWKGQISSVLDFVILIAAFLGVVLIFLGIAKLKAASDTQGQQVKWSEGLWRVGLGAAMLSLPFIVDVSAKTVDSGEISSSTMKQNYFGN